MVLFSAPEQQEEFWDDERKFTDEMKTIKIQNNVKRKMIVILINSCCFFSLSSPTGARWGVISYNGWCNWRVCTLLLPFLFQSRARSFDDVPSFLTLQSLLGGASSAGGPASRTLWFQMLMSQMCFTSFLSFSISDPCSLPLFACSLSPRTCRVSLIPNMTCS